MLSGRDGPNFKLLPLEGTARPGDAERRLCTSPPETGQSEGLILSSQAPLVESYP